MANKSNPDHERWTNRKLLCAMSQDSRAFEVFAKRIMPPVRRGVLSQCRKLGLDTSLVDDICQNVYLKAIAAACNDPINPTDLSLGWFLVVGRNEAITMGRRKDREKKCQVKKAAELIEPGTITSIEEQEDLFEETTKFFTWLEDDYRDLMEKVYIEKKTIRDAGKELGLSPEASYKRHQRALELLRDCESIHFVRTLAQI
jgi:RNA polymerase sigma factor (sigma-70 family)